MVMKTIAEARANFENAVSYIPQRYSDGIDKADWLTPAKSAQAEANYAANVGKAIAAKSRQKAIGKLSNEDWKNAAKAKGVPVIGERITAALGKWEANFAPKYSKVQSTVAALPPKTTDFMANINKRLVPVVKAWKGA